MEKGKSVANGITPSLQNLQLNPRSKAVSSSALSHSFALPLKKSKPRRLVSLCLGFLGQHLEDIITDISEIVAGFPPDIKLAMVAIARRRKLLNDDFLIVLAEHSWELLDISGSDVTDFGLATVAKICTNLQAVDVRGSPRSDFTARRCLSLLKPKLNDVEEESWEELDRMDICSGAQSLRWLVWPKIDEDSKMSLATECPRVIVNPVPSPIGFRGLQVPAEASASVALDYSIVEDIDPKTWAISGAARRSIDPPSPDDGPELPMAERFRLAFLERDARLAPKRAKNARQHRRRAEREYLMSSTNAKSIALASQASKFLHNRS
ncbi:uncharacterized protein [Elaeis guineensis]|uniref:uncharacterized protein isoform X3 n=1 Tax=Elaeis guineensis var. tenera TaxID=51953 RepID=UPI003C6D8B57